MASETDLRLAVFKWLKDTEQFTGGVYRGIDLNKGINVAGRTLTLKGPTGIWKPAGFELPLSITTSKKGPYDLDEIGFDGLLTYAYRGTNSQHRDNVGLRDALRTRTPLIYFKEVHNHRYQAIWPVIVLEDHPESLYFRAAIDPAYENLRPGIEFTETAPSPLDVRRYAWANTRIRLHQGAFRDIVLEAYDCHCAICRLQHPELLDAAHIIPDNAEHGLPLVTNGLSLCKIHHAAYDQNILGVSPDYHVHIRQDILEEHDGPMLKHGLQELNGTALILPRRITDYPDRDKLEERFRLFRTA